MRVKLIFKGIEIKQAQKLCQYAKNNQIVSSKEDIDVEGIDLPSVLWIKKET